MPRDPHNSDQLTIALLPSRRAWLWAMLPTCLLFGGVLIVRAAEESASTETAAPAAVAPAAASSDTQAKDAAGSTDSPRAAVDAKPAAAKEEVLPALAPYSVLLRGHVPTDSQIDPRFRSRVLDEIATDLRASMGQMWTTTLEMAVDGQPASVTAIETLKVEDMTARYGESTYDKVILAGVAISGSAWTIAAREWDAAGRTLGPAYVETTFDARLVSALAAGLIRKSFRAVCRIEDVQEGVVIAAARGGEFPPGDPESIPFKPGDLLIPFVRYYDREHKLQQIRDLPWTYVRVKTVERARMECETVSAFRTPLSGSRRRMEIYAIAARPVFPATRLILAPRGDASDPLPGCRVELFDRLPTADDPVEDRIELLTDRRGSIVINADPTRPLWHVLVHSGKAILGRVPIIPGLVETATLAIPDDSARLSVEGALSVVEGELIDAVSRRNVLMSLTRRAAKARKWENVDKYLEQLQSVPDYDAFRERIASIELPAAQAAKQLKDRVAESRVRKMCSDLTQAASGHLDADKIREFKIEMAELKQAAK